MCISQVGIVRCSEFLQSIDRNRSGVCTRLDCTGIKCTSKEEIIANLETFQEAFNGGSSPSTDGLGLADLLIENDAQAMAKAIHELAFEPPDTHAERRIKVRRSIEQRFSTAANLAAFEQVYASLV